MNLRFASLGVLNKLVVSSYKAVGFVVLTVLLLGLTSFIGLNAFFYVDRSWVAPTVVSPTDERVLTLTAQLAQQVTTRDKLAAERVDLSERLAEANRVASAQQLFQQEFKRTIGADLAMRRTELGKLEALRRRFRSRKDEIQKSNEAYATMARSRGEQLRAARLVDAEGLVGTGHQLSQIAQSDLALEENEASLESRIAFLRRDASALEAMSRSVARDQPDVSGRLSYEVLKMKEDHRRSEEELARAKASQNVLAAMIAANEAALARYDRILKSIRESPLLKASEQNITVAFVPYDNVATLRAGTAVYGCALQLVWCRPVGHVADLLEGEVAVRHPLRSQMERGLMVRLDLEDPRWAKERILFAGRAPLFL